ncbi:xanthine dehydrogenase subunit XdhC [Parafannyhessea umbonata]|jgi:carbon-monoxide dehydrogenase small subunit|uniref:(2Fe-2S)-binding protein n=1 Tax=Parafannyhessea umbonata TaxID=604330 RepID=A0A6N7WV22_9ACTN|nr:xanthine dehydrogenase subunit XdhC [Parafannyhessea umbonata]MCI6680933.1 (2Fe-2S)-binding protein [Parafannyhessea umbonata]MCI7219047.1 (2Fe-2S)-binding protein [Parafannyhessea umbonata]MDD6359082.1 (2Fe-2S)-binding protein [Parafannyhessea umbonata]MDD6566313.1 (2Fe-2S)-binding protein [Parafannyhessea umbonata]MDD6601233.1 (2Fe-2S)-binding protein [Parafannyhessea umbonata]
MDMRILKCTLNGRPVQVGYDPRESLLDTLRDRLHMTSVKRGCEVGECGACTVLIDGVATDTCLYLTDWAQGRDIVTVEGLQAPDGTLNPVQQAFVDEFAVQCGFCIPGIIMSAMEMVNSGKTFTRDEIRKNLSGHLCRCTGYMNVINGVEKAVDIVNGHVGISEQDAPDVDWSQRVKDRLEADCAQ